MSTPPATPAYQTISAQKLASLAALLPKEWQIPTSQLPSPSLENILHIPSTCGILTPREIRITEGYSARVLAAAMAEREYTAVEVTTAFCKRATISHQLTSCLTEPLFASALRRASFLDAHLLRTGTPLGPLHGLPISLKDTFNITGTDSSVGIAALAFQPATTSANIATLLLEAGAVIHCKTNVPQTMMALDSVNFVFGRTLNPGGRGKWTAGGSSGGEGVLVAMRGCVFGVGTDVGGSVRIPASVNGVVGFKPSVGRVPNKGCQTGRLPANGAVGVESCAGVLARGVEDVGTFLECVEEARAWEVDAGVLPGRWWSAEEGLAGRRPRIGVLWDDGVVVPLPPVKRVLADVVERLRGSGIEVVEVQPGRLGECQNLANKLFGIEGGAHLWSLLDRTGEPLIPWLQGKMKRGMPQSIDALRDLCARRDELRDAMAGAFWRDGNGHGDRESVDRRDYLGSPLAVQVVAPRLQERRLWDVMGVIEEAVRGLGGREAKL
ncbi:hypothetical protein MMC12_004422 [Toensbergia leucococca]|nr:hypothetical protein [Toensbergia leucococca]